MSKLLLLGEEPRQNYLYELVKDRGHDVDWGDSYPITDYDGILLPVPAHLTNQYVQKIVGQLREGQYVFGCDFSTSIVEQCQANFVEYMEGDKVAYLNAIATCEGAIAEAMIRMVSFRIRTFPTK